MQLAHAQPSEARHYGARGRTSGHTYVLIDGKHGFQPKMTRLLPCNNCHYPDPRAWLDRVSVWQ